MKLGLIARADNSGLGVQTHEFYLHMKPHKTLVMDISDQNGNKIYPERYPDATFVKGLLRAGDIDDFLEDLDVVFVAEAPYNYYLYARARELGVKTAVQYNYEFFDWFANPNFPKPDMLIAPSKWHYDDIQKWCNQHGVKHVYLHCPVNRDKLPPRQIKQARTFLHIGGRSAAHDRNGTKTIIEASKYLTTDAQILIHFQGEQGLPHQATHSIADYADMLTRLGNEDKVTIQQIDFENYQDAYGQGDVLLLPRRYGGNCLPLNEALSVGMPVIMTDISPNSAFLPSDWLVPAEKIDEFTPRTTIDIYGSDPIALALRIDQFYNFTESQFGVANQYALRLAHSISWDAMKSQYQGYLEGLCNQ